MGSFLSVIVAVVIGVGLATATTISVVSIVQQTPENTQQAQKPLVVYGKR